VVIAAGTAGKRKALFQALFSGGLLLWYPALMTALARRWTGPLWEFWREFHGAWVGITLSVALVLSVYSMLDYIWRYRSVLGIRS
jgi:phosphatidylglycerophosphate synthase